MGQKEFQEISEYPEYEINNKGTVRNRRNHVELEWCPAAITGKACVKLKDPDNPKRRIRVSIWHLIVNTWGNNISKSDKLFIKNWRKINGYSEEF